MYNLVDVVGPRNPNLALTALVRSRSELLRALKDVTTGTKPLDENEVVRITVLQYYLQKMSNDIFSKELIDKYGMNIIYKLRAALRNIVRQLDFQLASYPHKLQKFPEEYEKFENSLKVLDEILSALEESVGGEKK